MNSYEVCDVERGYVRLLVERKGGPEVVPPRPESETKCTILDPLEFGEVRGGSERAKGQ